MPGPLQKSIRRIAVAVLLLAGTAPAYADVPPPDPNSGLFGLIVYWIKLILHGEWGTLFGSVLFLGVMFAVIFGGLALLGWFFKPIEKMVEREREKEKARRLWQGIVDPPGSKSTFPINAVLLVRGIKSALGSKAEEQQPAASTAPTATLTGSRDPWEAARRAVQTDTSSSTVKDETKANPGTIAPAARPTIPAPSGGSTAATLAEEIKRLTQPPTAESAPTPPAKTTKIPPLAADRAAQIDNRAKPILVDHRSEPEPVDPSGVTASNKSVFISYRRHDSPHITGRIYDRLVTEFGKDAIVKDVDSFALGLDFREQLREEVGRCAVLIAVVGKNWNPLGDSGEPRLSDPRDFPRIEIESALNRNIPVIPVMVDGARIPAESDLPPALASLAYRNGMEVRPDPDFHNDANRLIRNIAAHLK
ncbi:MAG TPA: TIR domain-containing protein [Terracidiphilus sp.]|nr:TIR domain-containing protein [Terracidiphilus sp.]